MDDRSRRNRFHHRQILSASSPASHSRQQLTQANSASQRALSVGHISSLASFPLVLIGGSSISDWPSETEICHPVTLLPSGMRFETGVPRKNSGHCQRTEGTTPRPHSPCVGVGIMRLQRFGSFPINPWEGPLIQLVTSYRTWWTNTS